MPKEIIIYTTTFCPVCQMTKDFFDMHEVGYEEVNLDLRPLERVKLVARSKNLRLPQTFADGVWVSGFHPEKFLEIVYGNTPE